MMRIGHGAAHKSPEILLGRYRRKRIGVFLQAEGGHRKMFRSSDKRSIHPVGKTLMCIVADSIAVIHG